MTDARASRVAAEALTALAPARRASRTHGEALLGLAPDRRASELRAEVLYAWAALPPTTGPMVAALPRIGAALTGTATPKARTGTLTASLPRMGASLAGVAAGPPRLGAISSSLPKMRAAFLGLALSREDAAITITLPRLGAHFAALISQPPAKLPALTADLQGLVPVVIATNITWANDGYTYTGAADVDYDPAVADPPPHLHRQDVRRVHQSLPTPTLVRGRPQ